MQTEEILSEMWTQIQTFGGVQFTSTVKTKLNQDRDITVNFSLPAGRDFPLLDSAKKKPKKESSA